jgi:hypothetical protein
VNTAETSILVLFTFGATIFYVLLAIERRVWAGFLAAFRRFCSAP